MRKNNSFERTLFDSNCFSVLEGFRMEKSMKYVGSDGELPADVEIEEKYVS